MEAEKNQKSRKEGSQYFNQIAKVEKHTVRVTCSFSGGGAAPYPAIKPVSCLRLPPMKRGQVTGGGSNYSKKCLAPQKHIEFN